MSMACDSDEELRSRVFTIKEPESLPDILTKIPADRGLPTIEYAYDVTPAKGGRKKKRSKVYCAHCHFETHYKGYVVKWPDGKRCLVGVICGAKHYGADFHTTVHRFKEERNRQVQLQRYDAVMSLLPDVISAIGRIAGHPSINGFERLVFTMQRGVPDAWQSLAAVAERGDLFVEELIRDIQAEERLSEEESERRKGTPDQYIYTKVRKSIGTMLGSEFFSTPSDQVRHALRSSQKYLEQQLIELSVLITDNYHKSTLKKRLDDVIKVAEEAAMLEDRMVGAKSFFVPKNLKNVAGWLNQNAGSKGKFSSRSSVLSYYPMFSKGKITISLPSQFDIPDDFKKLRDFRSEIAKY